ncbi:DUF2147 domain-containing protein [Rhodoblastus sp.]|uniref:DUF2147 domain-containing protein n=1 Tax=Rhodoblastus sp. TaxID=1962975 RepID=UPI003F96C620
MSRMKTIVVAMAAIAISASAAWAGDPSGVWLRADGKTKVRFSHCGVALCGVVVWLRDKDSPAHIGQRVFWGMKPSGDNQWRGSAFNPDDGHTYSGKMSLSGGALNTAGCVLGGLICKSFDWSRAN